MPISKTKRKQIFEKSNGRCCYCHIPLNLQTMTVDHIKPLSSFKKQSDANQIDNLCACCHECNTAKAAMSLKEFRIFVNTRNNELLKLEAERRKAIARAEYLSQEIESKKYSYIHHLRKVVIMIK